MVEPQHKVSTDNERKVWDKSAALRTADGDVELLRELISIFLEDYHSALADIQQAVDKKDARKLERSAHRLKGSALNFGAEKTVNLALQLENMGHDNKLDGLEHVFGSFVSELRILDTELKAFKEDSSI
jgi:two-component system sensor histidine kinase/response regulator